MIYFLFFVAVCTLYFENEIKKYAFEVYKFIEFIHENNPLLLNYYENEYSDFYDSNEEEKEEKEETKETKEQQVELYENKYLKKFKNFTNDYLFNEKDLEYEQNIFNKLLNHHYSSIETLNYNINCHTLNLNRLVDNEEDFGKELLKKYLNGEMEKIDDENDETEFEIEVYNDYEKLSYLKEQIANQRYKLEKMSCELSILKETSEEQLNDELKEKAHTNMIEN